MRGAVLVALTLALGCGPVAGSGGSSSETTEMVAAPSPARAPVRAERAAPPQPQRFRVREANLPRRPGKVALRKLIRGGLGASFAPDGETLLAMRGRGGLLMAKSQRRPGRLPRRHFVSSAFSPDSQHVAVVDERKRLFIAAVPSGRKVQHHANAEKPRWVGPRALVFRRGCQVFRLTLGRAPMSLGSLPRPCGRTVATNPTGRVWWLAETGRFRRGVITTYKRLIRHDLRSGETTTIIDGSDHAHFMQPRVSADGRRACYVDADFDLFCRTGASEAERIARNVRRPLLMAPNGRWLLYTVGQYRSPDSQVGVVDLQKRTITLLPRAGRQWWAFLDDGRRIAGHGGSSSAIVYDLANGWREDVGDPRSEWEGLYPSATDPNRFVVGRERGGTRDLYMATIGP